jgi:hypothetical protein
MHFKNVFRKRTLCIDIINSFITELDGISTQEIIKKMQEEEFKKNYILIKPKYRNYACNCLQEQCICGAQLFKIKPYVVNFMRSSRAFFEIISISNLDEFKTKQLVQQFE